MADRHVLDVACGAGYAAPIFCEAGARRYWGVDISPEAIAIATEEYGTCDKITFRYDDACRLATVADQTIDVAISFETIEHVLHPRDFLWNLRRVLRPEGVLIISTPNRYFLSPGNDLAAQPLNPFHIREWNQVEFVRLLQEFFEIREFLGQEAYPNWKVRILHESGKRRLLGWMVASYLAAKRFRARVLFPRRSLNARDSFKVQALPPGQSPVYFVCVAVPHKLVQKPSMFADTRFEQATLA